MNEHADSNLSLMFCSSVSSKSSVKYVNCYSKGQGQIVAAQFTTCVTEHLVSSSWRDAASIEPMYNPSTTRQGSWSSEVSTTKKSPLEAKAAAHSSEPPFSNVTVPSALRTRVDVCLSDFNENDLIDDNKDLCSMRNAPCHERNKTANQKRAPNPAVDR